MHFFYAHYTPIILDIHTYISIYAETCLFLGINISLVFENFLNIVEASFTTLLKKQVFYINY